jgi:membrane protein implicated in regulation of membrane protease activity
MNPLVELNLALILFLPWFTILAVLFWKFPRQPRGLVRTLFDSASLLLAMVAAAAGMYWSMANADPTFGHMWQQVLATSVSYGLFLLVVTVALVVRWRWLRTRALPPSPSRSAAAARGALS